MESYKREFIQFLQSANVLKFGDFTAKSGRKIPYFINAGEIKTGDQISKLGEFYAKAYLDKVGNKKCVLTVSDAQILTTPVAVSLSSAYLFSASSKSLRAFSTVVKICLPPVSESSIPLCVRLNN